MTFAIHIDGRTLIVHTEVGDGLARVVVTEETQIEIDLEESE